MSRLSTVLVVHGEEDLIEECLQSISFADEIVIVDTGSSDRTLQIIRKYTDKVFTRDNQPNPNVNMNFGFDSTSSDWIFLTAPDERITDRLKEEIMKTIASSSTFSGYFIPRQNYFLHRWLKHGGNYPDWQLRLFQKSRGRFQCQHVHEHLTIDGETGYLKEPLVHLSYQEMRQLLEKIHFYAVSDFEGLERKGLRLGLINYGWYFFLRPALVFGWQYFWRLGILDGMAGFIYAAASAFNEFYRYAFYWSKANR